MEINNFSIFTTDDKCYQNQNILNDEQVNDEQDLNDFLLDKFDSHTFQLSSNDNLVEECKNKAVNKNKSIFLITDLSRQTVGGNFEYKCLIPKENKLCDFNDLKNLLKPFNDLINELFGSNSNKLFNKYQIN